MKGDIRNCQICGKEFVCIRGNEKYCSDECRQERHRQDRQHAGKGKAKTCLECGREFIAEVGNEKYCSIECRNISTEWIKNLSYHKKNNVPDLNKTCVVCGRQFSAHNRNVLVCSDECSRARKRELYHAKNDELVSIRAEIRAQIKQLRDTQKRAEHEEELASRMLYKKCVVCSSEFSTLNPAQRTCSRKCSNKLAKAKKLHRIPKEQRVDKDITLEALYERDSGVCYLCGGKCSWEDYDAVKKHPLPLYPSIDHIYPVSLGGTHSWDNVRLAHFRCNAIKSNNVIANYQDMVPKNAYSIKRVPKNQRKKVARYTKESVLIDSFESTADAEWKTGIKRRGIQKCARGEAKSYGGYVWEYI